jgi:hypothetical protein
VKTRITNSTVYMINIHMYGIGTSLIFYLGGEVKLS